MDLALWLHQGRVRGLIDLIDQLPRGSRYHVAIALDEDVAEELLDAEEQQQASGEDEPARSPWRPPLDEYDLHAQLLTVLIAETRQVKAATIASGGGKPKQDPPIPGPRTAREVVSARRDEAHADEVGALFGF